MLQAHAALSRMKASFALAEAVSARAAVERLRKRKSELDSTKSSTEALAGLEPDFGAEQQFFALYGAEVRARIGGYECAARHRPRPALPGRRRAHELSGAFGAGRAQRGACLAVRRGLAGQARPVAFAGIR